MTDLLGLAGYAEDAWQRSGSGPELCSAIDGSVVARMPAANSDAASMLAYARTVGGPALRQLTFQERGKILRGLADAIISRKEEIYDLSFATGATRTDAWLDIEGGAGTLFVYAAKARSIPDRRFLIEGDREAISKGNFAAQHILTPLRGAAVHINAYNFPVWGMLEKLGPSLLAGVPAIVKPASATAWLTVAAFRILVETGLLPAGSLQLLLGQTGNLFENLDGQDTVAFTGSAATAAKLRSHPTIVKESTRFTAEQDSLNASILGNDAGPDSPEFELFIKEVVREMTVKAGQKCTAIRRAIVPASSIDAVQVAIGSRLSRITIGDPRSKDVKMGALAGLAQRDDVNRNVDRLRAEASIVERGNEEFLGVDPERGAFIAPILLRADEPASLEAIHSVEAFGPVATLMPYRNIDEAAELARLGKGSLVLSIFSDDRKIVRQLLSETASHHGRVAIIDRNSAVDSTGHGSPMPHLVHGGPGRAGGGEELGGLRGMSHYMQRTAVQGSDSVIDSLAT